jgi:hypothetical protein
MNHKADVLIVTVADVESLAVMQVSREATGNDSQPVPIGYRTYQDLGEVKGAQVFMALSEMGAGGWGLLNKLCKRGLPRSNPWRLSWWASHSA